MRCRACDLCAAGAAVVLAVTLTACAASSPSSPTPPGPESLAALPVPTGSAAGSSGSSTSNPTPTPAPAPPGGGGTSGTVALAIASVSPATAPPGTVTLAIIGTGFDPSTAQLVITGPLCVATDPCIVSNEELTTKTTTTIAATVTIDNPGTFLIHVRNGSTGRLSSAATLLVTEGTLPSVSGISPARPAASSTPQTLSVIGAGFVAGLTATLVRPGGATSTLSGSDIQTVTRGSFKIIVTFADAGAYSIRVSNPDGQQSNTFTFALAPPATLPAITSISPANPRPSATRQIVSVSGRSFQEGLTVTLLRPGGATSVLSDSEIQNVTAVSFQMIAILSDAGAYSLRVNNPDGQRSNTFNFTVVSAPALPAISAISPSNPTVKVESQTVSVSGSNFQPGLTVTLVGPGGSTSTLSGSQIQNVTSNSFRMIITLRDPGAYSIRVTNSNEQQSNIFSFTARIVQGLSVAAF